MAKLKKAEIRELLRLSASAKLRSDFQALHSNRSRLENKFNIDLYIRFLTISNAFANHAPKKLRKMIGDNFRM